jgi:hypothetical protein
MAFSTYAEHLGKHESTGQSTVVLYDEGQAYLSLHVSTVSRRNTLNCAMSDVEGTQLRMWSLDNREEKSPT